jgi:hypothetical protein
MGAPVAVITSAARTTATAIPAKRFTRPVAEVVPLCRRVPTTFPRSTFDPAKRVNPSTGLDGWRVALGKLACGTQGSSPLFNLVLYPAKCRQAVRAGCSAAVSQDEGAT